MREGWREGGRERERSPVTSQCEIKVSKTNASIRSASLCNVHLQILDLLILLAMVGLFMLLRLVFLIPSLVMRSNQIRQ